MEHIFSSRYIKKFILGLILVFFGTGAFLYIPVAKADYENPGLYENVAFGFNENGHLQVSFDWIGPDMEIWPRVGFNGAITNGNFWPDGTKDMTMTFEGGGNGNPDNADWLLYSMKMDVVTGGHYDLPVNQLHEWTPYKYFVKSCGGICPIVRMHFEQTLGRSLDVYDYITLSIYDNQTNTAYNDSTKYHYSPPGAQTFDVAVVLAEPSDEEHESGPITAQPCKLIPEKTYPDGHGKAYYEDLAYCVSDYYRENSFGTVNLDFTIYDNGGSWFKTGDPQGYYVGNEEEFVADAIQLLNLSLDGMDTVIVIHQGNSIQYSSNEDDMATETWTPGLQHPLPPYRIIIAENDQIGAFAHEIGHVLGALTLPERTMVPDLYTMGLKGGWGGLAEVLWHEGSWDIMGYGSNIENGKNPSLMSSYTREFMELLSYDIHPRSAYGSYWINSLNTSHYGDTVFRYNLIDSVEDGAEEYYILEARNRNINTWDSSLFKDKALVLYRVDINGYPEYGYGADGSINNEHRRINIPWGGVLDLGESYRDMDNMVLVSAVTDRQIPGKYEINASIEALQPNLFEKIKGVILKSKGDMRDAVSYGALSIPIIETTVPSGVLIRQISIKIVSIIFIIFVINAIFILLFNRLRVSMSASTQKVIRLTLRTINALSVITCAALVALLCVVYIANAKGENILHIPPFESQVAPDTDLHLFCEDGRHIGVNYETGEYEVQIPDAIVSGDNENAPEWIFIPSDVEGCHYEVSAYDNERFLAENPEIAAELTDTTDSYSVYARSIDPESGIYTSETLENQVIEAGASVSYTVVVGDTDPSDVSVYNAIDQTPPIITPPTLEATYAPNSSLEIIYSAEDDLSGVTSISATLNDAPVASGESVTLSTLGEYTLLITATDNAGNMATSTQTFIVANMCNVTGYEPLAPASTCTFTNGPKTLQVKDSSCMPIPGARVNVRKANGTYLTYTTTNTEGIADLSAYTNLDASYFELDHHGATYSTPAGTFSTGTGVQTHPYELSLKGSDCNAISGARVNLRKANGTYVMYTTTNSEGEASFEVVPEASMKLEADYHGGTWMSEARTPDTRVTLGTDKFSLLLTDSTSNPIQNARVNLRKENNTYVMYTTTSEEGRASFEVLSDVSLKLEVDYHGATYQTDPSTTHEEEAVATIPFGLRLLDSQESPIPGVRVNLRKANNTYVTYATTNEAGIASFEVVPGAQMKLEVDHHGATYSTDVLDAGTNPLTQIHTEPFGLRFLTNTGESISGARVNLRKANGTYVTYATTDAAGMASFKVVPEALMQLEVDHHGATYLTGALDVDTNPQTTVSAYAFALELKDSEGNPIQNVRVNLRKANDTYVTYTTTNDSGIASFQVVPEAEMLLEADYHGGTHETEITTISADTTLQMQTSPITVLLTAQGEPLVNTRVDLLKENETYVTYATIDEMGSVAFEVLPEVLHKVRATYSGTTWVSEVVTGGSEVVRDF